MRNYARWKRSLLHEGVSIDGFVVMDGGREALEKKERARKAEEDKQRALQEKQALIDTQKAKADAAWKAVSA